jgi:hypothetical protein
LREVEEFSPRRADDELGSGFNCANFLRFRYHRSICLIALIVTPRISLA